MLFFGAATGRCGTMTLAHVLSVEPGVICLHEGKRRQQGMPAEQWLPYLTLDNVVAYHHPQRAFGLFRRARQGMTQLRNDKGLRLLGDVAYNNAPFVHTIPTLFPDAKVFAIFRDGRDFVRSAYMADWADEAPVGWPDASKDESDVERFISLGRLRPREDTPFGERWHRSMGPVERNAWLWAETNRLILNGLEQLPADNVLRIRFEEFFAAPGQGLQELRNFLGLEDSVPAQALASLGGAMNARRRFPLPHWRDWSEETMDAFVEHAGEMMDRLGYS